MKQTTPPPDDARARRRLLQIIVAIYIADTAVTLWAIAHGALEANPLYWAFHDMHKGWQGIADAMGVRVTLGVAILYALYRDATVHMLRLILFGYGTIIGCMTFAHVIVFLIGPDASNLWHALTQTLTLLSLAYAIALVIVVAGVLLQFLRLVRAYR